MLCYVQRNNNTKYQPYSDVASLCINMLALSGVFDYIIHRINTHSAVLVKLGKKLILIFSLSVICSESRKFFNPLVQNIILSIPCNSPAL